MTLCLLKRISNASVADTHWKCWRFFTDDHNVRYIEFKCLLHRSQCMEKYSAFCNFEAFKIVSTHDYYAGDFIVSTYFLSLFDIRQYFISESKTYGQIVKNSFKIKRTKSAKIINALRHKSCTKPSYLYLPVKIYSILQDLCYLIYEIMSLLQEIILHILWL